MQSAIVIFRLADIFFLLFSVFYRLKSKFNMPFNIYITGIVPPSIQPPNISYASESHFWFSSFHISFRWIYGFVMAAKCTFIYCRCSVMLVWCVTVVAPSFTVDIPYLMFFFVIYTILLCVSCLSFLIFEFNIFLSFFSSSLFSLLVAQCKCVTYIHSIRFSLLSITELVLCVVASSSQFLSMLRIRQSNTVVS